MESFAFGGIRAFAGIAFMATIVILRRYRSNVPWTADVKIDSPIPPSGGEYNIKDSHAAGKIDHRQMDEAEVDELQALKKLYYELHNLEDFPEILPRARRVLLSLLKETTLEAQALPKDMSILSIETFSREKLEEFQHRRSHAIGKEWEHYHTRRKAGGQRELFEDREEAIWWLKQIAPAKYVDGAWLGHLGKVTTPFALLKTMKGAWQILSEELGDGDLDKNHVHVYHKLLQTVETSLPSAEALDFGHPRHGLTELSVWKSAIAQLLISLFPDEFLPEILGFNLHFEGISMDTLKAGMELKEVGIDPYYFILHISIDNAHSGHSAIAIEVVCEYMDCIRRSQGDDAVQKAWEKLKAGYLLSSGLPGSAVCPSRSKTIDGSEVALNMTETEVMRIFKAKAHVVHGIHCSSRVRIGSRSVADWLDPAALESKSWQRELLDALSSSKYWICRGDSRRSRFIQELQWNGRMFGSFTQDEYNTLRGWIDGLSNITLALELPELESGEHVAFDDPALQCASAGRFMKNSASAYATTPKFSFQSLPALDFGNRPIFESFLPLWLTHPCLLQGFVSIPFRTKNKLACQVVKILRAQGGFEIEHECVAGMGEVQRPDSLGLAGIGMNMMAQHGPSLAALPSLQHVLQAWPSDFAAHMLYISTRPTEYRGTLIGMATAFAKTHAVLAKSRLLLLSAQDQDILQAIAQRELENLGICWEELRPDEEVYADCCKGFLVARDEIKKCFQL